MTRIDELRGYLLGTLTERDRDALEGLLLEDDELYEELLAVEEELIDESIRGQLSRQETIHLFQYLERLPDGPKRIQIARALEASLWPQSPEMRLEKAIPRPLTLLAPARRAWLAAIAASIVAVSVTTFLMLRNEVATLRGELGRAEQDVEPPVLDEGSPSPEASPGASPEGAPDAARRFPAPILTAGTLRGKGGMQILKVPAGEQLLRLNLDLAIEDCVSYRAVVYDAEARELFAVSRLQAHSTEDRTVIPLSLPTGGVPAGDYFIALSGSCGSGELEPIARYDFRVVNE